MENHATTKRRQLAASTTGLSPTSAEHRPKLSQCRPDLAHLRTQHFVERQCEHLSVACRRREKRPKPGLAQGTDRRWSAGPKMRQSVRADERMKNGDRRASPLRLDPERQKAVKELGSQRVVQSLAGPAGEATADQRANLEAKLCRTYSRQQPTITRMAKQHESDSACIAMRKSDE